MLHLFWLQRLTLEKDNGKFVEGTSCRGSSLSFIQDFVDQGKNLTTDKDGNRLPGVLANLLQQNGYLPAQVNSTTIEAEKATLFWLYDMVTLIPSKTNLLLILVILSISPNT